MVIDGPARLFSEISSSEDWEPETNEDVRVESVRGGIIPKHGAAGDLRSNFLSILPFGLREILGSHTHFEGIS